MVINESGPANQYTLLYNQNELFTGAVALREADDKLCPAMIRAMVSDGCLGSGACFI